MNLKLLEKIYHLPDILWWFPKNLIQKTSYAFDNILYKKRIYVEHAFQKLKLFRRIQIRYESLLNSYLLFVLLVVSNIIFKNTL